MKVTSACFSGGRSGMGAYPRFDLPEIAFAGRSNVGKSSALNRLCARRRLARTGATPGRTRQINFFLVADQLVFADLPGYGYAKVSREMRASWRSLTEHYFRTREELRGVVLVVDARRGLESEEEKLLDYLSSIPKPALLLATKVDKLRGGEKQRLLPALEALGAIPFSAVTGLGVRAAWSRLRTWTAKGEQQG